MSKKHSRYVIVYEGVDVGSKIYPTESLAEAEIKSPSTEFCRSLFGMGAEICELIPVKFVAGKDD